MKKLMAGAAVAMALTAMAGNAQAQATGSITARATVAGALTASTVQNLNFGLVVPGVNKTVVTTDAAAAGIVQFTGTPSAGVNITFGALPLSLTSGSNNLTINTYAAATAATLAGAQSGFTPASGSSVFLSAGSGDVFVFLGATVAPGAAQANGVYTSTPISITASYNGN